LAVSKVAVANKENEEKEPENPKLVDVPSSPTKKVTF